MVSLLLNSLIIRHHIKREEGKEAGGIKKGERQNCILPPCLFNFCAQYIIQNAGLDEAQAGLKIAGRNSNNLRYGDNTTLMAESEKELKSLLM